MKTQYYTATSLDGFIAADGHDLGWLMQFGEPEGHSYGEFIAGVGALAMGASTYEWILRNREQVEEVLGKSGGWPYQQPAWVFTHRELPVIAGADVRFVQGDVRPVHREMVEAAGGRNVWIVGGGELAGQFHDCGLLDELIIQVTAVTLGSGAPLLPRQITMPPLRLDSVQRMGEAFVELRYSVAKERGWADAVKSPPDGSGNGFGD